jgi:N-acetylmuramoyl-L-alanine amidase
MTSLFRKPAAAVLACLLVVGLFLPALMGVAQENVAAVSALRMSQDGGKYPKTRLVLELDKDVTHRWFTLPTPPRLVVDFPQIDFRQPLNELDFPKTSLIKAARAGTFRPGTTRMVLDLARPAKISVFRIPGNTKRGPRVVIDVVAPRPGEAATDVPPPPDVVTQPVPGVPSVAPGAPVVPRQVVQPKGKSTPNSRIVIVLDAGHGGVDPGACGKHLCEKVLTLNMVQRVQKELEKYGYDILLSRDKDVYVPLAERVRFAQRNNANLFVSMHADSHPDPSVKGSTVYMVSEKASDREAQRLANSENEGDIQAGVDLKNESPEVQSILVSLAQRDTMNHSSYLGQNVLKDIAKVTDVRKRNVLFAGFKVLKAPDVPSVLIEMGYITNAQEENQFRDPAFRTELAHAIANGIHDYVEAQLK